MTLESNKHLVRRFLLEAVNTGNVDLLPELIARFTRVVPFRALSAETLKDILRSDVIERMTAEFEHEGFTLNVAEEVLDHVVIDALRRETGARGLASILTKQLEDIAFDSFGGGIGGLIDLRMVDGAINVAVSPRQ